MVAVDLMLKIWSLSVKYSFIDVFFIITVVCCINYFVRYCPQAACATAEWHRLIRVMQFAMSIFILNLSWTDRQFLFLLITSSCVLLYFSLLVCRPKLACIMCFCHWRIKVLIMNSRLWETCLFHDCDRRCVLPGNACYKLTPNTYQPSRLTGVRLWAVMTIQSLW